MTDEPAHEKPEEDAQEDIEEEPEEEGDPVEQVRSRTLHLTYAVTVLDSSSRRFVH